MLGWVYDWLACVDQLCDTDLIFALAGQQSRKAYALELFHGRRAPRLLLSTGRFEIRRFAALDLPVSVNLLKMVAEIPPPQRHFFSFFEGRHFRLERIRIQRLGTWSEIQALARWLGEHPHITSLAIVSSGPHLRRVQACCEALLPKPVRFRLIGVPDESPWLHRERWWREKHTRAMVLWELIKIPCYRVLLLLQRIRAALRNNRKRNITP